MISPLTIDSLYPTIESNLLDRHSAMIILPTYNGIHGELNSVLCYTYAYLIFNSVKENAVCELLYSIMLAEIQHFKVLKSALLSLGINPIISDRVQSCKLYNQSMPKLLADLVALKISSINEYENILKRLKNIQVSALIERILKEEKMHLEKLKVLPSNYNKTIFH